MEHPEPYSDTDPKAMEVWLDLLRKMPAGQKIGTVFALSSMRSNSRKRAFECSGPKRTSVKYFSAQRPDG